MKKLTVLIVFTLSNYFTIAQTDNILWSSFQLKKEVSKNTILNIKPIFRFNEDFSSYQNMSVDIFAKQKFNKGWSLQLLARTWFIPDEKGRQFLWLDVAHGFKLKQLKIDNRLRYHWALDINDRNDPDYFRWSTMFSLLTKGNITPFIAIEPWLRTNRQNQFQRIRYEPGFNWKLHENYTLSILYRKEESINLEPKRNTNFAVINLVCKI